MFYRILLCLSLGLLISACSGANRSIELGDGEVHEGNLSTVNGSIRIGDRCRVVGEISTVNGSVQIGSESGVGAIRNVNGSISLGPLSQSGSIESVNGRLSLAEGVMVNGSATTVNGRAIADQGVRIEGDLSTVNGPVSLGPDSRVTGRLSTVNGKLQLIGAQAGSLETSSGSIEVLNGSTIHGTLRVRKPQREAGRDIPRIVIGAGSRVEGPLQFEREVLLHVHESAEIGPVSGAEPIVFSGDSP